MQICSLSASELSNLIRQGDLSPVEVIDAHLKRIEELEPTLNSFITVQAEEARAAAVKLDREVRLGKYRGPLHGIP